MVNLFFFYYFLATLFVVDCLESDGFLRYRTPSESLVVRKQSFFNRPSLNTRHIDDKVGNIVGQQIPPGDAPYNPVPPIGVRYHRRIPLMSWTAVYYWLMSVALVLFAGLASGLTVGLMSLDPLKLRVLEAEGTPEQKERFVANFVVAILICRIVI